MEGYSKYLNVADELDIMIFKNDGTSLTLKSFVYEVSNDEHIVIANPINEGNYFPLEKQYEYYFRFFIENIGMYLFKGTVMGRIQFDNLPSAIVKLSSDIKKIQRRRFFRVKLISTGNFIEERVISETELDIMREKLKSKYKNVQDIQLEETIIDKMPFDSLDISGGGLRVLTKMKFEVGDLVKGEFYIAGSLVDFKGEVTRVDKKESNRYEVGIRFLELDENTQGKIVAYVFEIERNLIKKGLM